MAVFGCSWEAAALVGLSDDYLWGWEGDASVVQHSFDLAHYSVVRLTRGAEVRVVPPLQRQDVGSGPEAAGSCLRDGIGAHAVDS
jgi:hypothetical protein